MAESTRILVVAATGRELAHSEAWRSALCGVGPVEAAVHTTMAIAEYQPQLIVHVGIAGARRHSRLPLGSLVIGTSSRYCDLGDLPPEWAPRELTPEPWLVRAAQSACPSAAPLTIGTSARVGGTNGSDVEAMEGFGVLRAAHVAGVPAIEVRAISNEIEEQDRTRWEFARAFDAITRATPLLVQALTSGFVHHGSHA